MSNREYSIDYNPSIRSKYFPGKISEDDEDKYFIYLNGDLSEKVCFMNGKYNTRYFTVTLANLLNRVTYER